MYQQRRHGYANKEPRRTINVMVRMDEREKAELQVIAKHHHMSASEIIRKLLVDELQNVLATPHDAPSGAVRERKNDTVV